jgi:hypothetical protein
MGNLDTNNPGSDKPLSIASFDAANLDPYQEAAERVAGNVQNNVDDLGEGWFDTIATQIVNLHQSPDIIALPGIQDNDGTAVSDLIDAIAIAGGPQYTFFDIPAESGQGGEQSGSNSRLSYLYNPERVSFIEGSHEPIVDPDLFDGDAFENSPKPFATRFEFNQQQIVLIDDRLSTSEISPLAAESALHRAQAQIVKDYANSITASDPEAKAVVLADSSQSEISSLAATADTTISARTNTNPTPTADTNTAGNATVNIIGTFASEELTGTDGNDIIQGFEGRDILTGGLGDDVLVGGTDGDMLTGGAGADRFVFNSFNERTDWITDFNVSEDKLILTDVVAGLDGYQGNDPIADGYMRFFEWGSSVRVQFDEDGSGPAVFTTLVELDNLTASDLVIGENVII